MPGVVSPSFAKDGTIFAIACPDEIVAQ